MASCTARRQARGHRQLWRYLAAAAGCSAYANPLTFAQVQREGNPLINELIIGTGFKDTFSISDPVNDSQFANFVLNPLLAQLFQSIGIPVPPPPRNDLLLLVQYEPPICPGCGQNDMGPVADLLRLNTGIPPTQVGQQKRLGFLVGDDAGFPNGRRPIDDVVDIAARAVGGILVDPADVWHAHRRRRQHQRRRLRNAPSPT